MSLDKIGQADLAENEFSGMKGKYAFFEARYQFGLFLLNKNRIEEAQKIFTDIVNEFPYLSSFEKRNNREWFNNAKHELRKISSSVAAN